MAPGLALTAELQTCNLQLATCPRIVTRRTSRGINTEASLGLNPLTGDGALLCPPSPYAIKPRTCPCSDEDVGPPTSRNQELQRGSCVRQFLRTVLTPSHHLEL